MGGIGKAVGGLFGGGGEGAARGAADAQVGETRRQFDITRQQMDPFRQAGLSALNMQLALMGLPQVGGGQAPAGAAVGQALGGGRGGVFSRGGGRDFLSSPDQDLNFVNRGLRGRGGFQGVLGGEIARRFGVGAGAGAGASAAALSGQPTQQFTREEALASLQAMPGQEFMRERQQQALLRQQAALGGLGGGQVRTELQRQAAGFAQQDLQNQLSRLSGLSSGGQQAAAQLGQFGQTAASNIGQARASGILGAQQAAQQQTQSGLSMIGTALPFIFSDERLKENVEELDLKACFDAVVNMPLKSWQYLKNIGLDTNTHIGPMAQEAPEMIRVEDMSEIEKLNLHDELMMIAGAIQYMNKEGMNNGCS